MKRISISRWYALRFPLHLNTAFLYSLNWVWIIEKMLDWINKNPPGYNVIEKIYHGEQVNESEFDST